MEAFGPTTITLLTSKVGTGVTIWLRVFRTIGKSHEDSLIEGFYGLGTIMAVKMCHGEIMKLSAAYTGVCLGNKSPRKSDGVCLSYVPIHNGLGVGCRTACKASIDGPRQWCLTL